MSISGSMYAGISGLTVNSQAMSVIGNNLANTNTIGFKGATIQFEDVFYSSVNTANGVGQVGHGAAVSSIYNDFSQGSYEASSEATDVAIGGNGFFMVDDPSTDQRYYTRAGNFRFDQNGYLTDPNGYRVQGWDVAETVNGVPQTTGAITDLQLDSYQSPPQATETVSMFTNLDKDADDNSTNAANPFFSMFEEWDGTAEDPIGDSKYAYQSTITVYDEAGSPQELTVYFDPVGSPISSQAGGNQVWEYIVTCPPEADGRTIDGQQVGDTSAAGLLMAGTMTFNAAGDMLGMTAFTMPSTATGNLSDLSNWTPAEFSDDGYPMFTANFSGSPDANSTSQASAKNIELNFGMQNKDISGDGWNGAVSNAAALGTSYANLFEMNDGEVGTNATTARDAASSTLDQQQDGFATGWLQSIEVSQDGVVTGRYSNGQNTDLFVLALADFNNSQGLILEGGNLFSEGTESGDPRVGKANTARFGSIQPNTLEQSNVDMSTEMVELIITQRGYQANSKIITTADTMLQEAINLKR